MKNSNSGDDGVAVLCGLGCAAFLLICGSLEVAFVVILIIFGIIGLWYVTVTKKEKLENQQKEEKEQQEKEEADRKYIEETKALVGDFGTYNQDDNSHLDQMFEFEKHPVLGTYIVKKYIGFNDKKIIIPKTYKGIQILHIAPSLFEWNTNITFVQIDANILEVPEKAFWNCGKLGTIILPDTIKVVKDQAFSYCGKLKRIKLPKNVRYEGKPFHYMGLEEFKIPEYMTIIPDGFLEGLNLKKVVIPSHVTKIGYSAFEDCEELHTVVIEDGVKEIGSMAFHSCDRLKAVVIPASVEKIGDDVFSVFKSYRPTTVKGTPDMRYNERTYSTSNDNLTIYCAPGSVAQEKFRSLYHCENIKKYKEN